VQASYGRESERARQPPTPPTARVKVQKRVPRRPSLVFGSGDIQRGPSLFVEALVAPSDLIAEALREARYVIVEPGGKGKAEATGLVGALGSGKSCRQRVVVRHLVQVQQVTAPGGHQLIQAGLRHRFVAGTDDR